MKPRAKRDPGKQAIVAFGLALVFIVLSMWGVIPEILQQVVLISLLGYVLIRFVLWKPTR